MEGQGINFHIFDDPHDLDLIVGKANENYLSWKKDDSLIKS